VGHLLGAAPAGTRPGIVTEHPSGSRCWTEISAVARQNPEPARVAAFAIDTPCPGDRSPGVGLEINGWAIGGHSSLVAVRAVRPGAADPVYSLDVRRPDVALDYPQFSSAAVSGFSFWVSLSDNESPWMLTVEGIHADGSTTPLAEVRGCLLHERPSPQEGSRLITAPDFVIIGTQRGGTTSLHAYLSAHPMVVLPPSKELHFLTDRYLRGRDWYLGQFPAQLTAASITGEATPYAMFHPHAPMRLRDIAPRARIIALLRNPVERAYSHYLLERSRGDEVLSFAAALDAETGRLAGEEAKLVADPTYVSETHKHASYMSRGDYARQLERWLAVFPRDHLLILRSEDLYEQSANTFRRVTEFLNLPPADDIPFVAHNRSAGPPLDPALRERLERHFAPLNAGLGSLLGWDPGWQ
jgi:hypothetical protein